MTHSWRRWVRDGPKVCRWRASQWSARPRAAVSCDRLWAITIGEHIRTPLLRSGPGARGIDKMGCYSAGPGRVEASRSGLEVLDREGNLSDERW